MEFLFNFQIDQRCIFSAGADRLWRNLTENDFVRAAGSRLLRPLFFQCSGPLSRNKTLFWEGAQGAPGEPRTGRTRWLVLVCSVVGGRFRAEPLAHASPKRAAFF